MLIYWPHYHDIDLSSSLVIQNGELVNIIDFIKTYQCLDNKSGERRWTIFIISVREAFPFLQHTSTCPITQTRRKKNLTWDFRNALYSCINISIYLLAIPNWKYFMIVFSFATDVFTAVIIGSLYWTDESLPCLVSKCWAPAVGFSYIHYMLLNFIPFLLFQLLQYLLLSCLSL